MNFAVWPNFFIAVTIKDYVEDKKTQQPNLSFRVLLIVILFSLILAIMVLTGLGNTSTDTGRTFTSKSTNSSAQDLASSTTLSAATNTTYSMMPKKVSDQQSIVTPFSSTPINSNCPLKISSTIMSTSTTTTGVDQTSTTLKKSDPQHCTVLEIGDSLGNELGWSLQRQLISNTILSFVQMDKSSTGLSNSWFYSWPQHLKEFLLRYRPNLLIVCLGGNDEQGMKVNGVTEPFGSNTWKAMYSSYIKQIVSLATSAGSYVLWVGMPVMQPYGYNKGMQILNSQYLDNVSGVPGTVFLPTWNLLSDSQEAFMKSAQVNGAESLLRSPDGIHFSYAGEGVFSTYVAKALSSIFNISLRIANPKVITAKS